MKKLLLALAFLPLAPAGAADFYWGGGITKAEFSNGTADQLSMTGGVLQLGYSPLPFLSIEARLGRTGSDDFLASEVSTDHFASALIRLGVPTEAGIEPYLLLGRSHMRARIEVAGLRENDTATDTSFGAGVALHSRRHEYLSVRIDYLRLLDSSFQVGPASLDARVNTWNFSIVQRF